MIDKPSKSRGCRDPPLEVHFQKYALGPLEVVSPLALAGLPEQCNCSHFPLEGLQDHPAAARQS
jgi:hypothetical protein